MPRIIIILFISACSKIVDVEVSNYLPFDKYSDWLYLDQNNNEFHISAIKNDSFFIILDFEGKREYIKNTGDMILIKRKIEYSNNENLIIAFDGFVPYFPYPFVNGFNKEYIISGNDYFIKINIEIQKDNLRYILNYNYFEKTINTQKAIKRKYVFAPDSFIVYAEIGPDTTILNNLSFTDSLKVLNLKEIILRNDSF